MQIPCANSEVQIETLHMISVIVPHLVMLVTTIANLRVSRKNRSDIKEVKRALNGKAHSLANEAEK